MAVTNWGAVGGTLVVMVLSAFAALWAQGAPVNRGMRSALYVTIGFVGSLFLLVGLIALLVPFMSPWGPLLFGAIILVPLWRRFREAVARIIPIDPTSATHAVALIVVMVAWLLAFASLLTAVQTQQPVPQPTALPEVLVQQLALVVLSFFAVGLWLRRDLAAVLQRLGLVAPSGRQLVAALTLAVALAIVALVFAAAAPGTPLFGSRLGTVIAAQLPAWPAAILVALTSAVAFETVFRGALQPRLGLPITSLTYVVLLLEYPFTAAAGVLVLQAVALGMLRQRSNTMTCVVSHATYNILLVVIAALPGLGS